MPQNGWLFVFSAGVAPLFIPALVGQCVSIDFNRPAEPTSTPTPAGK